MALQFQNFENEPLGSLPAEWTCDSPSPDQTGGDNACPAVSDTFAIAGNKSLGFTDIDDTGGTVSAGYIGYNDEDVNAFFAQLFDIEISGTRAGQARRLVGQAEDGSGNVVWSFIFHHNVGDGEDYDFAFSTSKDYATDSANDTDTADVDVSNAAKPDTRYTYEIVNPTTNWELRQDGSTLYEHGSGASGASRLYFWADDLAWSIDAAGIPSTFVFEDGDNILLSDSPHDYVFEGVEDEDVLTGGDSTYTFVDGNPVGTQ